MGCKDGDLFKPEKKTLTPVFLLVFPADDLRRIIMESAKTKKAAKLATRLCAKLGVL